MKLKQLFCFHKHLTGKSAFINKQTNNPNYTTVGYEEPIIMLECDRCGKLIQMSLSDMQVGRHNFYFDVDTTELEKYDFFGGQEKPEEK